MRWVRFEQNGSVQFGLLEADAIHPVALTWAEILAERQPMPGGPALRRDEVRLLAPVERPGKVVAIGLNYLDHCRETNTEPPSRPLIFAKFPTAVIGPGQPITWAAALTQQVDYEVELAVVIGQAARHVAEDEALQYVFGHTAANDVSARDLQFGDGQWVRGKSR